MTCIIYFVLQRWLIFLSGTFSEDPIATSHSLHGKTTQKIWESGHVSIHPLSPPTIVHTHIQTHTSKNTKIPQSKHAETPIWVSVGMGYLKTDTYSTVFLARANLRNHQTTATISLAWQPCYPEMHDTPTNTHTHTTSYGRLQFKVVLCVDREYNTNEASLFTKPR